ncbi:MAG: DUF4097 family beta strand repeat-containing protein [Ornithinimicrobium sp.]
MTTFQTAGPFTLHVDIAVRADIHVIAADHGTTQVHIRPRDVSRSLDVTAAEQAVVDHTPGRLTVKLKPPRLVGWFTDGGAVDITIEVPIGCELDLVTAMGDIQCHGEFASATLETAMGHIRIDHCQDLKAKTAMGDVTAERVAGAANIRTSSGVIRIEEIDGEALVQNGNGDTSIDSITGTAHLKAGNGNITLEHAGTDVIATSACGNIALGEVTQGTVTAQSASGSIGIGVREGSAAWLDLSAKYGRAHNDLEPANGPGSATSRVQIRARTPHGDITVQRSPFTASRGTLL